MCLFERFMGIGIKYGMIEESMITIPKESYGKECGKDK
jgi:hypothetical protein